MRLLLLVLALGAILVASLHGAARQWLALNDVELSAHGFLAMSLGVLTTLGLAVGLMMAMFHSSRSGHDDAAGRSDKRPGPGDRA